MEQCLFCGHSDGVHADFCQKPFAQGFHDGRIKQSNPEWTGNSDYREGYTLAANEEVKHLSDGEFY